MPLVDVLPLLTDPTDATLTTQEVDDISADLQALGGGTMFFAAADYYIEGRDSATLDLAHRLPDNSAVDHFHQGGIRLRSHVSLQGEPGTRLLTTGSVNCMAIASDGPFIWDSDHIIEAIIDDDVLAGATVYSVADSSDFTIGDQVIVRLRENPDDHPEVFWWAFAYVMDVGEGFITLDRPAQVADEFSEADRDDSHIIRKVGSIVENVSIRGFEMLHDPEDFILAMSPTIWLYYVRDVRVEDIAATDPDSGILVIQYGENVSAKNLHVRRSDQVNEIPYYGGGVGVAGAHGASLDDVRIEKFMANPVVIEATSMSRS